jgi:hypothetical protein
VIVHVAIDHEAGQQKRPDGNGDGQHPFPAEFRLEKPATAIELRAGEPQQPCYARANRGLLIVEALARENTAPAPSSTIATRQADRSRRTRP